ncbi:MAG: molybdopterin molybdotransferase MoeA [Pirellulaceae bacterium]|nr:molybdopterin molybdotransferase MoeA [Planctomycetales bacterium]
MIDIDVALEAIRSRTDELDRFTVDLHEALGSVLAEDIVADIDSPPHDKAIVDGYALRAADVRAGSGTFRVVERIVAGDNPHLEVTEGTCSQIMTGAPMPGGADAVVMWEETAATHNNSPASFLGGAMPTSVTVGEQLVRSGQNIMRQAASFAVGEKMASRGQVITPPLVGVLAEVGRGVVDVVRRPKVAVLATGDELVECRTRPAAGQIRNTNGPMLQALATVCGADCADLGIARDTHKSLRQFIEQGLAADVLLISGGVSAGVLDLVPSVLKELGVEQVFHKVRVKPGKPIWFGKQQTPVKRSGCLVFGLPGNPVSGLVCFELFVRPALAKLMGLTATTAQPHAGRLESQYEHHGDRVMYHPAVAHANRTTGWSVKLLPWKGSADLRTMSAANCLAILTGDPPRLEPGDPIEFQFLGGSGLGI